MEAGGVESAELTAVGVTADALQVRELLQHLGKCDARGFSVGAFLGDVLDHLHGVVCPLCTLRSRHAHLVFEFVHHPS